MMAIPIAHNYSAPNCSNAAVCSADCDNGRSEENNNYSLSKKAYLLILRPIYYNNIVVVVVVVEVGGTTGTLLSPRVEHVEPLFIKLGWFSAPQQTISVCAIGINRISPLSLYPNLIFIVSSERLCSRLFLNRSGLNQIWFSIAHCVVINGIPTLWESRWWRHNIISRLSPNTLFSFTPRQAHEWPGFLGIG